MNIGIRGMGNAFKGILKSVGGMGVAAEGG